MGNLPWTSEQLEIFDWFTNGKTNALSVEARAGSSKTTVVIEGAQRAPEVSVLLCAYNKRIAEELSERLPPKDNDGPPRWLEAKTLHQVGFKICRYHWPSEKFNGYRTEQIVRMQCELLQVPKAWKAVRALGETIDKLKEVSPFASTLEEIVQVGSDFNTFLDDDILDIETQAEIVRRSLFVSRDKGGGVGFADMIWLPIVNDWKPPSRYKLVVVDEAQDMSPAQILLAKKVSIGRMAFVGDSRQAIYKFRGAESQNLSILAKELKAKQLGLTISFRCAQTIVREAQRIVPDIKAAPNAPQGSVRWITQNALPDEVTPGAFILSRTNAFLIDVCWQLRQAGKQARIEGKDLLYALTDVHDVCLKKAKKDDLYEEQISKWMRKEIAEAKAIRSFSREARAVDFSETLTFLWRRVKHGLKDKLKELFEEVDENDIVCSTVHRAKGLERDRVFLIRDSFFQYREKFKPKEGSVEEDKPIDEEELNIEYVGITRAKLELIWVCSKISL